MKTGVPIDKITQSYTLNSGNFTKNELFQRISL